MFPPTRPRFRVPARTRLRKPTQRLSNSDALARAPAGAATAHATTAPTEWKEAVRQAIRAVTRSIASYLGHEGHRRGKEWNDDNAKYKCIEGKAKGLTPVDAQRDTIPSSQMPSTPSRPRNDQCNQIAARGAKKTSRREAWHQREIAAAGEGGGGGVEKKPGTLLITRFSLRGTDINVGLWAQGRDAPVAPGHTILALHHRDEASTAFWLNTHYDMKDEQLGSRICHMVFFTALMREEHQTYA
ncbi:hypothetical protein C8F04DRAFT_1275219 [Mycena alexandri]|uniref:Uncharacterized protein n=1 Tax=Mycena alexandri TaxID=1745969 RepID=A0AAD6WMV9_9AGAR|nr:hypothetical protein C8F04DRAFT_1275219 [Mycena alexandri]